MESEFSGRTAIVTGAASGIGAVVAEELAARGAHVIVSDLNESDAGEVADRIRAAGGTADVCAADVADAEASSISRRRRAEACIWR